MTPATAALITKWTAANRAARLAYANRDVEMAREQKYREDRIAAREARKAAS